MKEPKDKSINSLNIFLGFWWGENNPKFSLVWEREREYSFVKEGKKYFAIEKVCLSKDNQFHIK